MPLLKRHHPDVAGDGDAALDRAKRINIAHDGSAIPSCALATTGTWSCRAAASRPRASPRVPPAGLADAVGPSARIPGNRSFGRASHLAAGPGPGEPAERLARFLARVEHLTPDELDRLAAAEPPPIAFLATVRRFLPPDARTAFAAAEGELVRRVPRERWAEAGVREGLLGVAAELVLASFLDDLLAEPFRGRARQRLLRAWDASVDQPRYGPNGAQVARLRDRAAAMTREELAALIRASHGIIGDDRPWPESLDRDEDEALRISALLAARDVPRSRWTGSRRPWRPGSGAWPPAPAT